MSEPARRLKSSPGAIPKPTAAEAKALVDFAHTNAGLNLNAQKTDFLIQRLSGRLKATGSSDFGTYCALLSGPQGKGELRPFVEALTTHTTSFFREAAHFEWLRREGWSDLIASASGRNWPLTIWSAACSSGQELYTALISLKEYNDRVGRSMPVEAIGTDISDKILRQARTAVYTKSELKGLSEVQRRNFVLRAKDGSDRYRIAPELRSLCKWSSANLTELGSGGPRRADLILLRNVLIYFDQPTQKSVIQALTDRLSPGGILLTGHSEAVSELPTQMKSLGAAIFRKET